MNKEFKKWLKANEYRITLVNVQYRYWTVSINEDELYHFKVKRHLYKWRDIVYYSNYNHTVYTKIKYIIQCILDL